MGSAFSRRLRRSIGLRAFRLWVIRLRLIRLRLIRLRLIRLRGLWRMRVLDRIALLRTSNDLGLVAIHRVFRYGVGDRRTGFLGIDVRKGAGPVVLRVQLQRLSGILAICNQMNRHRFRADAILIMLVVPILRHLDADFLLFDLLVVEDDGIYGLAVL